MVYNQHKKINLITFPILVAGCIIYLIVNFSVNELLLKSIMCLGYLFSTYALGPDLDMPNSLPDKSLGFLWNHFWDIYGKAVPHRHWISHFPIVSSLIRFAYLFAIPAIITAFVNPGLFFKLRQLFEHLFAGIVLADNMHIACDIFSTNENVQRNAVIRIGGRCKG